MKKDDGTIAETEKYTERFPLWNFRFNKKLGLPTYLKNKARENRVTIEQYLISKLGNEFETFSQEYQQNHNNHE